MKHMPGAVLLTGIVTTGLIVLHSQVVAKDVRVPEDYPTINAAVQAARPGQDRVVVKGGTTYKESVFVNKDIDLVSVPTGARITADAPQPKVEGPVPEPPKNGLVAYWKMDSKEGTKVLDSSGHGLDGTFIGKPVWEPGDGFVGGGIGFASNGCISVPTGDGLDLGGEITVAAYIKVNPNPNPKPNANPPNQLPIISQAVRGEGARSLWFLQRNEGDYIGFFCRLGISYGLQGKVKIGDGRWHHVAGVNDGKEMRIYVDGMLDSSRVTSGTFVTSDRSICIGGDPSNENNPNLWWDGMLDEALVYRRALTPLEIRNLAFREGRVSPRMFQYGSGLIILEGASRVCVDGFVIEGCVGHGILVKPDGVSPVNLEIKDTIVRRNEGCGLLYQSSGLPSGRGRDTAGQAEISLLKCTVTENRERGVSIYPWVPSRLSMAECVLADNNVGITYELQEPPKGLEYPKGASSMIIDKCKVTNNTVYGVEMIARQNTEFRISDSSVESCGAGLRFDLSDSPAVQGAVQRSRVNRNKGDGILIIGGDIHFEVSDSRCEENGACGIACVSSSQKADSSAPGDITVSSCSLLSNGMGFYTTGPANLNATLSRSEVSRNKEDGVCIDNGSGSSLTLQVLETNLTRNQLSGVRLNAACKVRLSKCDLSNNVLAGVHSSTALEALIEDCRMSGNGGDGLVFEEGLPTKADGTLSPLSRIRLSGCSMLSNRRTGLLLVKDNRTLLDIRNCTASGNQNGVYIAPAGQGRAVVTVDGLQCTSNTLGDVRLDESTGLLFQEESPSETTIPSKRTILATRKTSLFIEPASTGLEKSLTFIAENSPWRTVGISQVPAPGRTPEEMLSALSRAVPEAALKIEPLAEVPFAELEKDFAKFDGSGALFDIGERFAKHAGMNRREASKAALQYIQIHPDSGLSCRLFQNLICDVLRFDDPNTAGALAAIVAKFPNSAIADAICTEFVMETLVRPDMSGIAGSFTQTCRPTSDSLSGILLASATRKAGERLRDRWAAFRTSYALAGKTYPAQRALCRGNMSHLASTEDDAGRNLLIRRCEMFASLLDLAAFWHRLGNPEMAARFLSLAGRARLAFRPATPNTYCLPGSLSRAYLDIEKAIRIGGQIPGTSSVPALTAILDNAKIRLADLRARTSLYRGIVFACSCLPKSGEIGVQWSDNEFARSAFEAFLGEAMDVCKRTSGSDAFQCYAAAMRDYAQHKSTYIKIGRGILDCLEDKDRSDGCKWFVEQTMPFLKDKPDLAEVFHVFFLQVFLDDKDLTGQAFHLAELAKMNSRTEEAYARLQRLSDLYVDQWKLPAQAIQIQRRVIELFPGSEKELQARLKIAKIQYSERAFQEAIYELTQLLAKLPQDYQDAPARTMLGLAYIATAAYEDARDQFAQVINKDTGEHREQCLYLVGYSYICEQKYSEAVKPFKDLINLYPNGPHTKTARDFLGKIEATGPKK